MHFQWGVFQVIVCILGVAQLVACEGSNLFSRIAPSDLEMCSKESGVTAKDFEAARARNDLNHNMLCFLKCALEKVGFLEGGKLNVDAAKDAFPDRMSDSAEACFKGLGPVSTCDDLQKVEDCLPSA